MDSHHVPFSYTRYNRSRNSVFMNLLVLYPFFCGLVNENSMK